MTDVEIRHFHFFAGLGGGAKGFNRGRAELGKLRAKYVAFHGAEPPAEWTEGDRMIKCDACATFEPMAVYGCPGKLCPVCNCWEEISRREFRERFKTSFWRWHKAYCDAHVSGGYQAAKKSLRMRAFAGKLLLREYAKREAA